MRTSRLRYIYLVVALVFIAFPPAAEAHSATTHYLWLWPNNSDVTYQYTPEFPTGEFVTRTRDGATTWNDAGGFNDPEFFQGSSRYGTDYGVNSACPLNGRPNGIHYEDLDSFGSGTIGITAVCHTSTTVVSFQLAMDNDRDWYTGTGDANDGLLNTCLPSCQSDYWSVVTHEWGHATGFTGPESTQGHFSSGESICDKNDSQATMCPNYDAGTERMRTLSTHDIHTFDGAYLN